MRVYIYIYVYVYVYCVYICIYVCVCVFLEVWMTCSIKKYRYVLIPGFLTRIYHDKASLKLSKSCWIPESNMSMDCGQV